MTIRYNSTQTDKNEIRNMCINSMYTVWNKYVFVYTFWKSKKKHKKGRISGTAVPFSWTGKEEDRRVDVILVLLSPCNSLLNWQYAENFAPVFKNCTSNPRFPLQKHSEICHSEASPQKQTKK